MGHDSSVGIATRYGLNGAGTNSRRGEIFRICPDRPWGSSSLPHCGYRGSSSLPYCGYRGSSSLPHCGYRGSSSLPHCGYRGSSSLPYCGYRVSFQRAVRSWRGAECSPSPSAEVKERVELYVYSTSGSSWLVLGWNLPVFYPFYMCHYYCSLVIQKKKNTSRANSKNKWQIAAEITTCNDSNEQLCFSLQWHICPTL